MTPITSPQNPRLKQLRKLARARERERTGLFVAEGEDLVLAAHAAGREPEFGFCAPGVTLTVPGTGASAVAGAGAEAGIPGFEEIAPELLADVSMLGSGTRAIGVYEQKHIVFKAPLWTSKAPLCVYLHAVKDPGNVGTVLRSAQAFGAAVALGPGCADPHSPKAVRASMGAIFAVPLGRVTAIDELPGERVALVAHAGEPLQRLAETLISGSAGAGAAPVTLLVGAEREGLPRDVVDACDHVAHIPIASESLNAAMAATVALYEMTTQINGLTDRGARRSRETLASGSNPRSGQLSLRSAAPPSRVPAT